MESRPKAHDLSAFTAGKNDDMIAEHQSGVKNEKRGAFMYSFYALVSRMKNIDRWALMRNFSRENVQEHSHMVAVIAHALALIRKDVFGKPCDADKAAAAALYHDASEIFTGDMPTPIKYHDDEITEAYKRIEKASEERLVASLPEALRPSYEALLAPEGLEDIIKAADRLSAYIKCIEELKAGNGEFRMAAEQTKNRIKAMNLPEADYFMENFIPAFELTLDELKTDGGTK